MNNVRSAMCLSFLMYAVVLGYLIAMQFRADLPLSHVGIALLVSGNYLLVMHMIFEISAVSDMVHTTVFLLFEEQLTFLTFCISILHVQ